MSIVVAPRTAVIIEDDADVRALLAAILAQAGFDCHAVGSGDEGVDAVREHSPVLTTLDVSLPGFDGLEVARRIRSFSDTYILMLSAKDDEMDVVMGFAAGADDYVTKPFRPRELRARVEAVLRRRDSWMGPQATSAASAEDVPVPVPSPASAASAPDEEEWLDRNGLRAHPGMRLCEVDGVPVELTRSEFDLLLAIVERDRLVVSKDTLALHLRGDQPGSFVSDSDRRSVEVHLANLRRKLGDVVGHPRFIETVRGVGYRLAAPR
ncbi:response regulator transcription factor [Auraticoccus monumenti]|uniref:DNA-binding response regulator, OmpR family, contains REC and winged-helix (WHTH) domain n=1 Tax=Auraticoccus monumenti TaxID=675864 RepID=A0A1G6RWG8_9ACTN|nr:response regulator transcription factor [Auraticoccus monumenti]SDD08773.1 DNA-binding response regulator, OmpR family, contains REC and winged-helix (wHTH) domain [Auraticoccus monumenti]